MIYLPHSESPFFLLPAPAVRSIFGSTLSKVWRRRISLSDLNCPYTRIHHRFLITYLLIGLVFVLRTEDQGLLLCFSSETFSCLSITSPPPVEFPRIFNSMVFLQPANFFCQVASNSRNMYHFIIKDPWYSDRAVYSDFNPLDGGRQSRNIQWALYWKSWLFKYNFHLLINSWIDLWVKVDWLRTPVEKTQFYLFVKTFTCEVIGWA